MTVYGRPPSRWAADRPRAVLAIGAAFALVLVLSWSGWLMLRPTGAPNGLAGPTPPPTAVNAPVAATPGPRTSSPAKKAAAKPSRRPTARATPTRKPPPAQLPPPPPAPSAPSAGPEASSCTHHPGPDATMTQVRTALVSAGAVQYWRGARPPADLTGELPAITVPANLMKAVAWQESSWRSTVIACDGGIGVMQVMPGTAAFVNSRFGTSYDVHTLSGNASLGAAYLEWLTMYFGLYYFGSFDLTATAPIGTGGATMLLRDAVVGAYNVGPLALEDDHGTPDGADDTLSIPNRGYVSGVTSLLTSCACLAY